MRYFLLLDLNLQKAQRMFDIFFLWKRVVRFKKFLELIITLSVMWFGLKLVKLKTF